MAATFSDLSSHPVTVILPSGKAATWNEYSATAQPSGIAFRYLLNPQGLSLDIIQAETDQFASAFNAKARVSGVQSISTYDDTDAAGQIVYRLSVVVQSDSGNSTQVVDIPQSSIFSSAFNDAVEPVRELLNAQEGL